MLLVKKCQFFHYLFSLKITLEIGFNNVLQRKELFFTMKKKIFLKVPKVAFFQRGSPMLLVKKCQIFLYLFLVKTRLEIRFNNVLATKEPFSDYEREISESPKNRIFPKWLTHTFGQKMPNFHLFKFGQNKTRKNA